MFTELVFRAQRMEIPHPTAARGWASTKIPCLPSVVFHRDSSSVPMGGPSPFTVQPCRGGVAIIGVGHSAATLLISLSAQAQTEFRHTYPDGEFTMRLGTVGINIRPYLKDAVVHDLVLQTNAHPFIFKEWKQGRDSKRLTEIAEKTFRVRLAERADVAGVDVPDEFVAGDFVAIPSPHPVMVGANVPKFAVELRFRTNAHFVGPWNLGIAASKGAGRLRNVRTPAAMETVA